MVNTAVCKTAMRRFESDSCLHMEDLKAKEKQKSSETSESEQKNKLERLVKSGEWKRLNESSDFRELSLEGKILILFETINNRRKQLTNVFTITLKRQPKKAKKIQEEMHYLDETSEALGSVLAENIDLDKEKNLKKAA